MKAIFTFGLSAAFSAASFAQSLPDKNPADVAFSGLVLIAFVLAMLLVGVISKNAQTSLKQKGQLIGLVLSMIASLLAIAGMIAGVLFDTSTSVGGIYPGSHGYFVTASGMLAIGAGLFWFFWRQVAGSK